MSSASGFPDNNGPGSCIAAGQDPLGRRCVGSSRLDDAPRKIFTGQEDTDERTRADAIQTFGCGDNRSLFRCTTATDCAFRWPDSGFRHPVKPDSGQILVVTVASKPGVSAVASSFGPKGMQTSARQTHHKIESPANMIVNWSVPSLLKLFRDPFRTVLPSYPLRRRRRRSLS